MWVSKTPFTKSAYKDKADLDMSNVNKLWWYPPQPSLRVHQHPIVNTFLTRHLLLWMPRKLWNMKLHCTWDDCGKHPVTSAGMYPHVRHVLDLDGYYSLVTEILRVGSAPGCGSQEAVFIITNNYTWEMRVVRSLRWLGFGTSLTQLQKKLTEQHKEQWLSRNCSQFDTLKQLWRLGNNNWSCPKVWWATIFSFSF